MRSEAEFALEGYFLHILAQFFQFLADFGKFWGALGRPLGQIFRIFGVQKSEQILRGFLRGFFRTPRRGRRDTRWPLRLTPRG